MFAAPVHKQNSLSFNVGVFSYGDFDICYLIMYK